MAKAPDRCALVQQTRCFGSVWQDALHIPEPRVSAHSRIATMVLTPLAGALWVAMGYCLLEKQDAHEGANWPRLQTRHDDPHAGERLTECHAPVQVSRLHSDTLPAALQTVCLPKQRLVQAGADRSLDGF